MPLLVLALLVWRLFDFLVALFAPRFIPYLGFFAYPGDIKNFQLPPWVYSFANFDGAYYIRIAKMGYHQYEQAFFPLYPLLIKLMSPFFANNHLVTGLLISNIAFLSGLLLLNKLLRESEKATFERPKEVRRNEHAFGAQKVASSFPWILLFLLTFPTSFFFASLYTEGLFFLFVILTFFFLRKKQFFYAALIAFLAALTRLSGALLIVPLFIYVLRNTKHVTCNKTCYMLRATCYVLSPLLGLSLYCLHLLKTTGDPFFFFSSQPIFGANRTTHLVLFPQVIFRYLKIFLTANHNFQYYVSLFEFSIFLLVFLVLAYELWSLFKKKKPDSFRLSLNLFSLANLLLPALTGTFSSIPRYALLSLSFFLILAELKNYYLKSFIAGLFMIAHTVVLAFFIQGYFIG